MSIVSKREENQIGLDSEKLNQLFEDIVKSANKEFNNGEIDKLKNGVIKYNKNLDDIDENRLLDIIIRESNDAITKETSGFTFFSASALLRKLYKNASKERGYDQKQKYGDYFSFVVMTTPPSFKRSS